MSNFLLSPCASFLMFLLFIESWYGFTLNICTCHVPYIYCPVLFMSNGFALLNKFKSSEQEFVCACVILAVG